MAKLSLISRICLFLAILFFSVFLGGYIARQMIVYQLFEPDGQTFKSFYNEQNLSVVHPTILPVLIMNLFAYAVFLLSSLGFFLTSKIKVKYEGWLFAIILIIAITAPFEIYLSTIDLKLVSLIMSNSSAVNTISELIKERMNVLSSFSLIEVFSFAAIIFLFLFQPLRKKNEN